MKLQKAFAFSLSIVLAAFLAACASHEKDRQIVQAGWFDSFAAGGFKGFTVVESVSNGAAIGLGTFEGVDGELIILDGKAYRASYDGKVEIMEGSATTPFAIASKMDPDWTLEIEKGTGPALFSAELDKLANAPGAFLAIKGEASFETLKLRAPPGAQKPYPQLSEVIAKQRIFELKGISGTLIGFKTPPAYKGMNAPGYHFHFISDDKSIGGHVLDFKAIGGKASIQRCDSVKLLLPEESIAAPSAGGAVKGESLGH